jgi:glucan 1,3-beta-glucosidase
MKFTLVGGAAAMASSAMAIGELAFNLGVQRNSDAQCKVTSDYESDFSLIKSYSTSVKTYALSDCNTLQQMGPALDSAGFSAFLGVWPTDEDHYEAEKTAAQTYLPQISVSSVKAFTVGSEALYRGDLTPQQLADKINDFRSFISGLKDKDGNSWSSVPVGTVDSWNVWVNSTNAPAIQASDMIMGNAYSYWQGQTMQNASFSFIDDIMQALQVIQTAKGAEMPFYIGETGWPTAGGNYGSAVPNVQNAETFWQQGICAILGWGINTIVFEAFDESWKPETSGVEGVEQHWGVLDSSGTPKYNINCNFTGTS